MNRWVRVSIHLSSGLILGATLWSASESVGCAPRQSSCGFAGVESGEECDFNVGGNDGVTPKDSLGGKCCSSSCKIVLCPSASSDAGNASDATDAQPEADVNTDADSTDGAPACLSADFDGTGTADMKTADKSDYDFAKEFTIEAWIKPEGTIALNRALVAGQVAEDMTSSFNSYYLGVNSEMKALFGMSDGTTTALTSSMAALTQNTWAHIAGVFDGTTAYLYVDGQKVSETAGPAAAQPGSGLSIGHSKASGPSNLQFNGKIKDVRLSTGARYTGNFTPIKSLDADAQTVGLFHLNSGTGGSSPDSSTKGNPATITGSVPFVNDCP